MKRKVFALCMLVCLGSMVCLFGPFAAVAQDTGEQPFRFAGLLDKLTDSKSKESRILQGVGSILGSTSELDYQSERTIGESLALEGFRRYGMPVKDADLQKYINLVGNAVARNSLRPGIPYTFVVVDNPLQNAFSCPGGIIFISSGLLKTIRDEAQLAGILAHEVAHVGHKHALQSIQRARFFQGAGTITSATMKGEKGKEFENMIGSLQETLFDKGLDQNMEFEADKSAMETAYRTGYDPEGIIQVLREMKKIEAQSQKQGSWFSTHPPLGDRIRRCEAEMNRYPDAKSLARLPARYKLLSIVQQPQTGKAKKTKP
jgi:predicted Zn-dependent protease